MNGLKHCSSCDEWKPADTRFFTTKSNRWDKLNPNCKKCNKLYSERTKEAKKMSGAKRYIEKKEYIKSYNMKWRIENPDKVKIISRRFAKTDKGKLLKLMAQQRDHEHGFDRKTELTTLQWHETIEYFNGCCAYCGKDGYLTQDHFIPLSKMGIYSKKNIIPACESCNLRKNTKDFNVWYTEYEHYSFDRKQKILRFIEGFK